MSIQARMRRFDVVRRGAELEVTALPGVTLQADEVLGVSAPA